MIQTVIIDDEEGVRKVLKQLITKLCPQVQLIGEAASVDEGVELIKKVNPQLVLLDIQMPGGTGFDILERLGKVEFKVIFITAFDQYAIKAIKFSALDYVLKPIQSSELLEAIEKYSDQNDTDNRVKQLLSSLDNQAEFSKIAIPSSGKTTYVDVNDIVRFQAEGSYTDIYLVDNHKLLSSKPIKEYEEMLNSRNFFRVHRSHLINLKMVKEFSTKDREYAIMQDGTKIEVSRNHRMEFKAAMSKI